MIDILISFRTTYQDPFTGVEVELPIQIAKHYFFGKFWLDLFSTIPVEKFVEFFITSSYITKHFKLFACIKLIRILRLSRLIDNLN